MSPTGSKAKSGRVAVSRVEGPGRHPAAIPLETLMSHDDARAMVRRYAARQARRHTALPMTLLCGLGLGLAALARARDDAQRAETLAHDAEAHVVRARSASLKLTRDPLAIAAVGLAFGLAIWAFWPPSDTERRLRGPARRRLIKPAADFGAGVVDQFRQRVQGAEENSMGEAAGATLEAAAARDAQTVHAA
jgi:hypothetical protein